MNNDVPMTSQTATATDMINIVGTRAKTRQNWPHGHKLTWRSLKRQKRTKLQTPLIYQIETHGHSHNNKLWTLKNRPHARPSPPEGRESVCKLSTLFDYISITKELPDFCTLLF
uniref:Uncharacterized protein n=1 Tax=Romanomermis culicivorax TaxID=13658 RepID=A0A915K0N5_ROMCU